MNRVTILELRMGKKQYFIINIKLNRQCLLNCIGLTISDKIKVFEFERFSHEAEHINKRIQEKE